jgi:hypothetical protein
MLAMWGMLLVTGQVEEIGTEPFRIAAHWRQLMRKPRLRRNSPRYHALSRNRSCGVAIHRFYDFDSS